MSSSLVRSMLNDMSIDNPYLDEFRRDNKLVLVKKKNDEKFIPSELRVSTITALSDIGVLVDTNKLYTDYDMDYYNDKLSKYMDSEKYGELDEDDYPLIITLKKSTEIFKGVSDNKKKKKTVDIIEKKKKRDSFQNQLTFIIAINQNKSINLKLFKNGKIQMTGLRKEEDGYIAINKLISNIKHIPGICENNKLMKANNLNIILINSDFEIGFKIRRDELFKIIGEKGLYVVYEPDIYPGVNSKYFYNTSTTGTKNEGICCCGKKCDGKGNGNGDGDCKKITIAIFQSGSIIITGSKTNEQMVLAYKYINSLIQSNIQNIKKNDLYIPKCQIEGSEKVYYIKKNSIQNASMMANKLI